MKASDFAIQQLPDVVQSYILYGRISSLVTLLLDLVILYGCWWVYKITEEEDSYYGGDKKIVQTLVAGTGAAATLFHLLFTIQEAVLVWAAPKIWLIKELGKLI